MPGLTSSGAPSGTPSGAPDEPLFAERQWLASVWWVTALVLLCAALGWQTLLWPPADVPAWLTWLFFAACGVVLPVAALSCRLETTVTRQQVVLRYVPLRTRVLPGRDVLAAEVRTYRPIAEYGGWGIRGWGDDKAYSVRGKRGVRLELAEGASVLIGSQRPEELAAAVYRMTHSLR